MAIHLEGGCRVFGLREGDAVRRGGFAVWRHVGRESGSSAISLSTLEVAPGASVAWRNGECDEVLFVVEGEGDAGVEGKRFKVLSLDGIFARPGDVLEFRNSGYAPLTLLQSRCPDPGPGLRLESRGAEPLGSRLRVSSPLVRFEDQPTERAGDGRWFRVLVDSKSGCEQTTQFVGFIPPGRAPDHFHEYEEVICILRGEGLFWSGANSAAVGPGTCLYLPRRQPHCLENTGANPLSLYGLFHPSGSPAVRFHPGGGS